MLATDELSIRPYSAEDDPFIADLARDAFLEYTPRAVPHTLALVRRCTTFVALHAPRRREPSGHDIPSGLADRAGAIERARGLPSRLARVGFAAIGDEGDGVLSLHAIAVVRGQRGRGVGVRLMGAFEQLAARRGAHRLELCTADYNLAALDLFYRHGFRLLRRRERFYERGQDACVLVKDLR
jgi:ribosomal protein S18 acetylase RimI-like enzyme